MTDGLFAAAALALMRNITAFSTDSPGVAATHFFLALGPMSPSKPLAAIQSALAAAAAEGIQASLLNMTSAIVLDGCGGHPGPMGHWQMALEAAPQIRAALGW